MNKMSIQRTWCSVKLSVFILLGFVLTGASLALGQVANSGFEAPALAAGGSQYRPGGTAWNFVARAGITTAGNGWQSPAAPEGVQMAFLQSQDGQINGSCSQQVYLTPGRYAISFKAALRGRYNTGPLSFNVTLDGVELNTFTLAAPDNFASYTTVSFQVDTAGKYPLQFTVLGTPVAGADNSIFLDAVTIDRPQLANWSFEAPNFAVGGSQFRPGGADWNFVGRAGITEAGSGWEPPIPSDGRQAAFLQRLDGQPNGSMSQSVYLTPGTYSLSFKAALRQKYNTSALSFNVTLGGATLNTFTLSTPSGFASYTTASVVVNTEGNYIIQFAIQGTAAAGTDNSIFLDAVTLDGGPGAGTYKLVARHSGQVLAPLAAGTANQTPLATQPYNGGTDKQWVLQSLGGGEYALKGVASNRNINVLNSDISEDAPVRLYDWVSQPNFKFKLKATEDGYYNLVFAHSGKPLTVQDASRGFDAPIVQEAYSASAENAQWKFLPVSAGSGAGTPFSIVALPDTQEYVGSGTGATPQIFYDQISWINAQRTNRNIAYVASLGDITGFGGNDSQWQIASTGLSGGVGFYGLDNTVPYGVVGGNHDFIDVAHTNMNKFNAVFGIDHFLPKSYYGGHYGTNNENHYDYISAGGKNFIVVYMTWRDSAPNLIDPNVIDWVNSVLQANPDRRAIVISHELIDNAGIFKLPGQMLYDKIKGNSNLFLMLCGHYTGEGIRTDTYNGNTVTTVLADYQDYPLGGEGRLRELQFVPNENLIIVRTYSPTTGLWYTGPGSQFTIPYDMQTPDPVNVRPLLDTRIPSFMIVNKASGKALDLTGGNTANGALVSQLTYNANSANQRFTFAPTELNDHFRIASVATGKFLFPHNSYTADSVQIEQWAYVDSRPSVQWDLVDAGNGWYKIRNVNSGKVMEVANSSTADNAKVQQSTDTGAANQLWRLQPWGDYYVRTSAGGSAGKYLAVQNGGTINGTPIVQSVAQNTNSFKWRFESADEGFLKVTSLNAAGRVISVKGNATTTGAICHIWDYSAVGAQKVRIVPMTNGRFGFSFSHDNLSWDIKNNSGAEGAILQQYTPLGNDAQKFILQRVP